MSRFRIILTLLCCTSIVTLQAQTNGTNSSYSRFGMGLLSDPAQSYNRDMGGVALGLRSGKHVNTKNPASYAAIDSLTFLLDVGASLQRTQFSLNGNKQSTDNTMIDQIATGFRLLPHVGMSVGFMPFSSIGYSFSQQSSIVQGIYNQQTATQTISYDGDGGLHEAYIGMGWQPHNQFSVGFNIGYLWGNINHSTVQSFSESGSSSYNYSNLTTYYTASLNSWKADFGVQYQNILNPQNRLTVGATVSIGHKLSGDATILRSTQSGDTIKGVADNSFQIPMTYSIGAAWEHADKLTVAADITYSGWADCTMPQLTNTGTYEARKGAYLNRWQFNAGTEYTPERYSRSYLQRVSYRAGLYYSTPYLKVNGQDGPREYGISAGLGLPIQNRWNNRSTLNIGIQWARRTASSSLIKENIFLINIGLSFNEMWFRKWKIQ